jgi:hypothetical protein
MTTRNSTKSGLSLAYFPFFTIFIILAVFMCLCVCIRQRRRASLNQSHFVSAYYVPSNTSFAAQPPPYPSQQQNGFQQNYGYQQSSLTQPYPPFQQQTYQSAQQPYPPLVQQNYSLNHQHPYPPAQRRNELHATTTSPAGSNTSSIPPNFYAATSTSNGNEIPMNE